MKIGHIYINGLIGTSFKEDGSIEEKGVELLDVVQQLNKLDKDITDTHVHINSKGGYVTVGDAIAKLISTIPNCSTFAEGMCASIATKIHLSVPLQNRFVEAGCQYMIHNPFLTNASGDAQTLKDLSNSIQQTENELESMYAKATGLDKKIVSGLMAQTTFLTPEQCVDLNFATKILSKQQAKAVALLYNEKTRNMKNDFSTRVTQALAVLSGKTTVKAQNINPLNNKERGAKALLIATDKGDLETPFEDLMVGDPVMLDGEVPEDGTYEVMGGEILLIDGSTASTGTVIEVVDGMIDSITPAEVGTEASANGEGVTLESLSAKLAELEAKLTEKETALAEAETVNETITKQIEQAAAMGSKWNAPRAQAAFRDKPNAKEGVTVESMKERQAMYKNKRK